MFSLFFSLFITSFSPYRSSLISFALLFSSILLFVRSSLARLSLYRSLVITFLALFSFIYHYLCYYYYSLFARPNYRSSLFYRSSLLFYYYYLYRSLFSYVHRSLYLLFITIIAHLIRYSLIFGYLSSIFTIIVRSSLTLPLWLSIYQIL